MNWFATTLVKTMLSATRSPRAVAIKHLHRVGGVRSRLPNGRVLRLWSRADDWVSNQVYWKGWAGYEPETVPLFFRLATEARVALDVGAYVGFYTLIAAHANPRGRIYSFEPLAMAFERLRSNVARNGLRNVECFQTAVGDTNAVLPFYHAIAGTIPCSSSLSQDFVRDVKGVTIVEVPVTTLDAFAASRHLDDIDLLKLDTESTEPSVLRGARVVLERSRPWIICEVLAGRGAEGALESVLRPFGYRFYHLTPEGPVMRERVVGHPSYFNYLFAARPADEARLLAGDIVPGVRESS